MSIHPSRQAYVEDVGDEQMLDLASVPVDYNYSVPNVGKIGSIAPEKASAILNQMDRKRKAAAILVPTDDGRVRARLRDLGEPITLFGENKGERRDRLRDILYHIQEGIIDGASPVDIEMGDRESPGAEEEEYYTPGDVFLLQARQDIARYSLPRARNRIQQQKQATLVPLQKHIKHRKAIKDHLSSYQVLGSQVAGERAVSIVRFSPNSKIIAAGAWTGSITLLNVPNLDTNILLRGHTDKVGGLSWHPQATISLGTELANVASGGAEGNIHLWSLGQETPLASLTGHSGRVVRVEHHPSGNYLASASYDTTWRLWDLTTQKELLYQEGHSRELYSVAFQGDGALIASGGLDSIGRVWDLRTGRTIMVLDGHIRDITGLDWHPDGYRVASSSGDATVKVWDIRMVRCTATIGAHKSLVSDVRFFKGEGLLDNSMVTQGTYFVTAGFDGDATIFSSDDWAPIKKLSAHTGHVMSVDISQDAIFIASSGKDRTVKLWAREDIEL